MGCFGDGETARTHEYTEWLCDSYTSLFYNKAMLDPLKSLKLMILLLLNIY